MKIDRAFRARATSWPMINPPIAGDATTLIGVGFISCSERASRVPRTSA